MNAPDKGVASTDMLAYLARNPRAQGNMRYLRDALVAQLDRALDYESRGREFESSRARHFLPIYSDSYQFRVSVCSQKTSVLTQI